MPHTFIENKQVISVSFASVIQELKSDPQMINIIYKILTANNSEHTKIIIMITLSNTLNPAKIPFLDLAEKHYEKSCRSIDK
jgi:hypothetical protein